MLIRAPLPTPRPIENARTKRYGKPFPCFPANHTTVMQYQIQFLDAAAAVIGELIADAHNAAGAVALVADLDWPPHAVSMRVLDADGREVHSEIKGAGLAGRCALELQRFTLPMPELT
jgi:hypothetical protein